MTRPLRGAIVGFGAVAEHGHVPGWRARPGFEIVAVADPRAPRRLAAERLLPGIRAHANFEAMLATEGLDFIDVASPPAFHADAIVAAAGRGLHILCEKPLVTQRSEYARIAAAVDAAGVTLHPVHNWRFAEAFRWLRAQREHLGAPRELRFQVERNGWSVSAGDWRADPRLGGGGILVDHGWHNFYLALELAGVPPRSVQAQTERRRYHDAAVEDSASCTVEFDDCRASIDLTWAGRQRRTAWELIGSRGRAWVRDGQAGIEAEGRTVAFTMAASLSEGSHHADWFPAVIDSFAAAIADPDYRAAMRREAERCLEILEAAYTSAAAGGVVVALAAVGD